MWISIRGHAWLISRYKAQSALSSPRCTAPQTTRGLRGLIKRRRPRRSFRSAFPQTVINFAAFEPARSEIDNECAATGDQATRISHSSSCFRRGGNWDGRRIHRTEWFKSRATGVQRYWSARCSALMAYDRIRMITRRMSAGWQIRRS